jgi:hypothetical protein
VKAQMGPALLLVELPDECQQAMLCCIYVAAQFTDFGAEAFGNFLFAGHEFDHSICILCICTVYL